MSPMSPMSVKNLKILTPGYDNLKMVFNSAFTPGYDNLEMVYNLALTPDMAFSFKILAKTWLRWNM